MVIGWIGPRAQFGIRRRRNLDRVCLGKETRHGDHEHLLNKFETQDADCCGLLGNKSVCGLRRCWSRNRGVDVLLWWQDEKGSQAWLSPRTCGSRFSGLCGSHVCVGFQVEAAVSEAGNWLDRLVPKSAHFLLCSSSNQRVATALVNGCPHN